MFLKVFSNWKTTQWLINCHENTANVSWKYNEAITLQYGWTATTFKLLQVFQQSLLRDAKLLTLTILLMLVE